MVSGQLDSGDVMGHVAGRSRDQLALFPTTLNEAVGADHPVRVVDAFVEGLDLSAMGFSKWRPR
jgi:hypothetical protein